MQVVVTGAAGRTGLLTIKKLLEDKEKYSHVVGTVRNKAGSGKALTAAGFPEDAIVEFDLAAAVASAEEGKANPSLDNLSSALKDAQVLIIATSGVPQVKYTSLLGVIAGRLVGRKSMPSFTWKKGETPEQVDWLGQKLQIDAAKEAGVKQVILISSMGGTDPNHFLNTMGDGGNILQWKRKAEQYLMASGLPYTIIHPGGLIDEAGGSKQLVLGVDDKLLERSPRNIPRADVAALAVGCIDLPQALNRSFDVLAVTPEGGEAVNNSYADLFGGLKGNCDYSINSQA
eukprot:gene10885-11039_t